MGHSPARSARGEDSRAQDPSLCPRHTYPRRVPGSRVAPGGSPLPVPTGSLSKLRIWEHFSKESGISSNIRGPFSDRDPTSVIHFSSSAFSLMHLGMWIGNKLDLREFFFLLKCFLRSYLECVCVCDGESIHFQRPIRAYFSCSIFLFYTFF